MREQANKMNNQGHFRKGSYLLSILMLLTLFTNFFETNHTFVAGAATLAPDQAGFINVQRISPASQLGQRAATRIARNTLLTAQIQTDTVDSELESSAIDGLENEAAPEFEFSTISVTEIQPKANGRMRIGVMAPAEPQADIIFVHGHADRLDNHGPLFRHWANQGYRVISFDLPSHGESRGQILPIDLYSFEDLFGLVRLVEEATLEDADRPLILAGWSFGGLVMTRLHQQPDALATLRRAPQGLILITPVVVPLPFSGGDGISRMSTLTHNPAPEVAGPPIPAIPLLNPLFAGRLLLEAYFATESELPQDLPILLIAAGDTEDWYVDTEGVLAWADDQQAADVNLAVFQCEGARHMLDHEPFPIGQTVHNLTADFVTTILDGQPLGGSWYAEATATQACTRQ